MKPHQAIELITLGVVCIGLWVAAAEMARIYRPPAVQQETSQQLPRLARHQQLEQLLKELD